MLEDELDLVVREIDIDLTKGLLEECEEEFTQIMQQHTSREYSCKLNVREDQYLTEKNRGTCGGVIIYANKGRIVCANTLEDRLALSFDSELPRVREMLFPSN